MSAKNVFLLHNPLYSLRIGGVDIGANRSISMEEVYTSPLSAADSIIVVLKNRQMVSLNRL